MKQYDGHTETMKESEGLKYDGQKLRVDLIDPWALEAIAKGLTYGAEKYGENNWLEGIQFSRVYGALLRHLIAWYLGEEMDEESGNHHFDHAGCMWMMLNRYAKDKRYEHLDDRPFKEVVEYVEVDTDTGDTPLFVRDGEFDDDGAVAHRAG